MVFSSVTFVFYFLPVVIILYFLLAKELKNYFLLIASLFFYAWGEPKFVFVMIGVILVNYIAGLLFCQMEKKTVRTIILVACVIINLGILGYYKYFMFLMSSITKLLERFTWKEPRFAFVIIAVILINLIAGILFGCVKKTAGKAAALIVGIVIDLGILGVYAAKTIQIPEIALPIGLSFFIFQGLSYVIDVYRGNAEVQKNPAKLALYVSLFPQLIAGPIVRYSDISSEIDDRKTTIEEVYYGLSRFIIGLGKKVVIADVLAGKADQIFTLGGLT